VGKDGEWVYCGQRWRVGIESCQSAASLADDLKKEQLQTL